METGQGGVERKLLTYFPFQIVADREKEALALSFAAVEVPFAGLVDLPQVGLVPLGGKGLPPAQVGQGVTDVLTGGNIIVVHGILSFYPIGDTPLYHIRFPMST